MITYPFLSTMNLSTGFSASNETQVQVVGNKQFTGNPFVVSSNPFLMYLDATLIMFCLPFLSLPPAPFSRQNYTTNESSYSISFRFSIFVADVAALCRFFWVLKAALPLPCFAVGFYIHLLALETNWIRKVVFLLLLLGGGGDGGRAGVWRRIVNNFLLHEAVPATPFQCSSLCP